MSQRREKLAYLEAALAHVTQFRLAVDAGAHVGKWSRAMAERFEQVMAFEPMDENRRKWLSKGGARANISLIGMALGDRAGLVRMDGEGHSQHYAVADPAGAVTMVTLDEYGLETLDFLKVDCEGADTLVLRGAAQTLLRCRPVVMVESCDKFQHRYGLKPGAPLRFLEELGAVEVECHHMDHIFVFPRA
jgi:FkbM family methyltransferase